MTGATQQLCLVCLLWCFDTLDNLLSCAVGMALPLSTKGCNVPWKLPQMIATQSRRCEFMSENTIRKLCMSVLVNGLPARHSN